MNSSSAHKIGLAIKRFVGFASGVKGALAFIGVGLALIILGFVYPELGGFLAWVLDILISLFSPSSRRRRNYEDVNISDPWYSFCIGGGFLFIGFGWLAIAGFDKHLKKAQL